MDRQQVEGAIESLDSLLQSRNTPEEAFQKWFEDNPVAFYVLGFHYHIPHPKIKAASGELYIPDFMAKRPNSAWEVIELKASATEILRNKDRRETFYASFESYLSQCHEYSEALDDSSARRNLEEKYSIDLMQKRPSSILIAGSGEHLDVARLLRLSSRRTPPIAVYTYDDLRSALLSYRTFNFGEYDSANGICVHSVMYIHRPNGAPTVNHILDIGMHHDRDRVSIYIDEKGCICLRVLDTNGAEHLAHSAKPFEGQLYEVAHWFLFEVGVSDGFGFISIQIDGRYYADIRINDFPFHISHEYVIGSDWEAKAPSWFSFVEMAVLNRALSFEEKMKMRTHSVNAGRHLPAELMDLNWSAYYSAGPGGRLEFRGHKWMHTARHPAGCA
ncbi:Shedu anti-phage system protein SduA domain-containing protein [Halomonas korlensis]|uniref:Shedu protein SduA C-terminal domain-containing protein n=1 Tax=Halomonas korlensis TaxID=463301 RepID=A0A1I7IZ58_9GAMM|nr:Shedu anti-phage system protein SduA domain-containing protein [Halomonas korlensis]SFU78233.1 protein of unknown function [Halomonas korlensis]